MGLSSGEAGPLPRGAGTGPTKRTTAQFNEPAMIAFVYCGTAIVVASFWGTTSTENISKTMSIIQLAQGLVELD